MARLLVVQHTPAHAGVLSQLPGLDTLDVETVTSNDEALRRLEAKPFDALLLCPCATVEDDLAFLARVRTLRPGIRAVFLADAATPESVIAAVRAEVFAVFTAPFDAAEIADLVRKAAESQDGADGIRVLGAAPHWITLRVRAQLVTADRVVAFMDQLHKQLFEEDELDQLLMAFREILLNAIEHGAGFDADKEVRVDAVRTRRALTFYFRDPGPGFVPHQVPHAATEDDPMSHMERREEAGIRPGGFGVVLSRQLVDEVVYSQSGNEVLLVKHLD
jgi:anti-sigma regulatory factor (Ser/Thr protein kinase)/CheY-like chemotaxis protein